MIAETPVTMPAWSSWTFLALVKEHASLGFALATTLARMLNDAYAAHEHAAETPA